MNELIYSIAKTTSWLIADEEEKVIQYLMKWAGYRPNEITDFVNAGYKIISYQISDFNNIISYRLILFYDSKEIKHKDIEITLKVN